jgi:hypothetical protein
MPIVKLTSANAIAGMASQAPPICFGLTRLMAALVALVPARDKALQAERRTAEHGGAAILSVA